MKKRQTILIIDRDEEPKVFQDILDFTPEYIKTSLKNQAGNTFSIGPEGVIFH